MYNSDRLNGFSDTYSISAHGDKGAYSPVLTFSTPAFLWRFKHPA